jgi:hypothetical protein
MTYPWPKIKERDNTCKDSLDQVVQKRLLEPLQKL